MQIKFELLIMPKPSNKRHAMMVGGHARVVQDQGVRQHQASIAVLAAQHRPRQPIEGPIEVEIVVVLPRPAYLCRRNKAGVPCADPGRRPHISRPDVDNLSKSCLDGLRAWWRDDCQVHRLTVEKFVAALDELPHYEVTVTYGEAQP